MRLRSRIDAAAQPGLPARNPFRFGAVPAARAPVVQRPAPLPSVAETVVQPSAPPITLVGLAEQSIDGAVVRTAVLSMSESLHYVKAGERVGSSYEVVTVGEDVVELKDLVSGTLRTLRPQPYPVIPSVTIPEGGRPGPP